MCICSVLSGCRCRPWCLICTVTSQINYCGGAITISANSPLVMEQSVTTAAMWHCFTATVWRSFTVVVWCSCVLLVLCVASTVSRRSLRVCVVNTVSRRSLRVCCWYCLLLVGSYQRRQLSAQLASPS